MAARLRGAAQIHLLTSTLLGYRPDIFALRSRRPSTHQSRHVCQRTHRPRPGYDLHVNTTSHLRCELAEPKHDGVRKLVTQRHDGPGQGHHLILDAMVSDFLWLLAVVRLVGLLHDPISGAAQGLVSWSRLIGCNPWTAMRCLRSARAITFERRRCVDRVPLFRLSLEEF